MYGPLATELREIRVLHVAQGAYDQPLHCSLHHLSLLGSIQPYKALSYTWGDANNLQQIMVNGQLINATANLVLALKHLRSATQTLVIWVDAVCINQKNNTEVSDQVGQMRDIFLKAAEVLVWIGEEQPGDAAAIGLVKDFAQDHATSEVDALRVLQDPATMEKVINISCILNREYWGRAWVVQETMFNNNITAHIGMLSVPWRYLDFAPLFEKLERNAKDDSEYLIILGDYERILRNGGSGSDGDPGVGGIAEPAGFLRTLVWYRQLFSTDPRDKVYAFCGLLGPLCPPFPIDYTRSVQRVYVDVVQYLVATTQRLDVIGVTQPAPSVLGIPSWAPDWQHQPDSSSVNLLLLRDTDPVFHASRSSTALCAFSDDDLTLTARGFATGVITHCGKACVVESMAEDGEHQAATLAAFHDWHQLVARTIGADTATMVEFCRVVTCDFLARSMAPEEVAASTVAHFQALAAQLDDAVAPALQQQPFPEYLLQLLGSPEEEPLQKRAPLSTTIFMNDRRFVVLSGGQMGLVPQTARLGDTTCVFMGCAHPVVLRPSGLNRSGRCFTVLGEAFVHGLMYGEQWTDESVLGAQDFVLY